MANNEAADRLQSWWPSATNINPPQHYWSSKTRNPPPWMAHGMRASTKRILAEWKCEKPHGDLEKFTKQYRISGLRCCMASEKLIALRIQLYPCTSQCDARCFTSIATKPLSTHSAFATYDSIRIDSFFFFFHFIHHDAFWLRTSSKSPSKSNSIVSFWTVYWLRRGGDIIRQYVWCVVDKWNHKLPFGREAAMRIITKKQKPICVGYFDGTILLFCLKFISNWCDTRVSTSTN